jgi:hypothetical protein
LSTRDFEPSLRALLGEETPLPPSTISRVNQQFHDEYETCCRRPVANEYVYLWADGVYQEPVGLDGNEDGAGKNPPTKIAGIGCFACSKVVRRRIAALVLRRVRARVRPTRAAGSTRAMTGEAGPMSRAMALVLVVVAAIALVLVMRAEVDS